MVITNIILFLILVAICVGGWFTYKLFQSLDGRFAGVNCELILLSGLIRKSITELETFRRDFNLLMNNELAKKIEAVLNTGAKSAELIKTINEDTGEVEWVKPDKGY